MWSQSFRFYLLSVCFPSVHLPETLRSWCPWSAAREEDRPAALLPFPWSWSLLAVPLSPVCPPRKPVQFANQAENYFLGSLVFFFCMGLLLVLSFWATGDATASGGKQRDRATRGRGRTGGGWRWKTLPPSSSSRECGTGAATAFPPSARCCRLAPCPCSLCSISLEKAVSFFWERF